MTDIQRFDHNMPDPDGDFVTYADHVEALRQAEQRGAAKANVVWASDSDAYEQGQRDALALAVQRFRAEAGAIRAEYAKPTHRLRVNIVERLERAIKGGSE